MHGPKITVFIITGPPGVGKTTLVRNICAKLSDHYKLAGFYTEEVRANGQRIGFDMVSLSGERAILARENPTDNVRRPRIGKYSVYVNSFEDMALTLLAPAAQSEQLFVIDEVGKMELLSKRFEKVVDKLLKEHKPMLVTVPSQTRQPIPIVDRLKNAPEAITYQVTKSNRAALIQDISEYIIEMLPKGT